jgi:hypothetical protein
MKACRQLIPVGLRQFLQPYDSPNDGPLFKNRLIAVRLAVRTAGGDDAKRIAETTPPTAVSIVLDEVDRRVRELAAHLKSGRGIDVSALLKEAHDALRGLRSEINLPPDSTWGKQRTAARAEVSKILSSEAELAPGRVRAPSQPAAGVQGDCG